MCEEEIDWANDIEKDILIEALSGIKSSFERMEYYCSCVALHADALIGVLVEKQNKEESMKKIFTAPIDGKYCFKNYDGTTTLKELVKGEKVDCAKFKSGGLYE